uniref:Si:dkey-183n20.15 n=1 Tax=Myripristis murdjan TaxID=586833 RepID=A0A667XFZ6_9TELE
HFELILTFCNPSVEDLHHPLCTNFLSTCLLDIFISFFLSSPSSLQESSQLCPFAGHRDAHCPVCLQTASFPVQTNCGHLFCAPCLLAYWRHGSWLDAISCPLCRQKVCTIRSDRESKEVLGEITDYNKRYSGAPRRMTDYLCDAPLLLQLLARGLGTMGGLVWLFFFRVALCCVGTMMSFSSPSANPVETDPSPCGLLGVLDDLVVVILLLTCLQMMYVLIGWPV